MATAILTERTSGYPVMGGTTPVWARGRYVRLNEPRSAMTDEKECDCPVYPTCGCRFCEACIEELSVGEDDGGKD